MCDGAADSAATSSCVRTLYTDDTEYTADSVEWCPWPDYSHVFLCGTYQLTALDTEEGGAHHSKVENSTDKKLRKGRLYAYTLLPGNTNNLDIQVERCHETEVAAILDIKWDYGCQDPCPRFSLVDADGELSLWHLARRDPEALDVVKQATVSLGEDRLALSLDWSSRVQHSSAKIAASDSKGCISVVSLDSGGLEVTSQWKAHDFEAWIVGFNYWNTELLYSGGDDCKLIGWDSRLPTDCPVFTSRKHSAGVCSIQSHPFKEHTLATGSYDENVYVWDTRQMRRPVSETPTGGGVWRVKWDPWAGDQLLVADMYNGFHILDCSLLSEGGQDIVCSYQDHKSIAYGADWCHKLWDIPETGRTNDPLDQCNSEKQSAMIATCSFYDHALKIWTWSRYKHDKC